MSTNQSSWTRLLQTYCINADSRSIELKYIKDKENNRVSLDTSEFDTLLAEVTEHMHAIRRAESERIAAAQASTSHAETGKQTPTVKAEPEEQHRSFKRCCCIPGQTSILAQQVSNLTLSISCNARPQTFCLLKYILNNGCSCCREAASQEGKDNTFGSG